MPEYIIAGIPVNFPFEPYDVQKAYMEKVIMCLEDGSNSVLESPTGTGKTLSLLCSSLSWLLSKKAALQEQVQKNAKALHMRGNPDDINAQIMSTGGKPSTWGIPKIIYASRTHSQLTQAMQELKRTSYAFMRAVVLGSRDQLCIHPEVMREQGNSSKTQMCQLRVKTRSCSFYVRVEGKKDHPDFRGPPIMDIEDLVKVGQKLKICPYYSSKELVADADIIFMPYNYLLDPKARKANKIELNNAVVILDEAHNIEKICEESASVMIRSSDIAMAIEDVTYIMKKFHSSEEQEFGDDQKDFSLEDLALLKEMLLDLEKAVDDIKLDNKSEGSTFPPTFIFELLSRANFTPNNMASIVSLLEKLIQFLSVETQNTAFRKGGSLQILADFLTIVFVNKEELIAKVHRSFKVHVQEEIQKNQNAREGTKKDGWISKAATSTTNKAAKVINYWCFNPGFGMEQLLNTQVRSVILTSGTLAPLKPLIAELAIPIKHQLENPHIVNTSQVYVKIIGSGPDREQLISNYANRDNPKYISSLGQTILNVARIVPDGLLVFFPSYPLLNQCVDAWQASGLWSDLSKFKPIYVEPRNKDTFTTTMEEFYQSIKDSRGACFMAVCRGKVSEGLDFADRNGRAVIITGLPYPPLKDPKIILKKRYLEDNRTKANELLSGNAWYDLEATRAVNQAIGRVIRHRYDYGAILLCDSRFQNTSQVQQLSKWIRGHLGAQPRSSTFGPVVRELREFFKNAENAVPKPKERSVEQLVSSSCEETKTVRSSYFADPKQILEAKKSFITAQQQAIKIEKANSIESWSPADYTAAAGRPANSKAPSAMDFMSRLDSNVSSIDFNNCTSNDSGLVTIHKRSRNSPTTDSTPQITSPSTRNETIKKKRFKLVDNHSVKQASTQLSLDSFAHVNAAQIPSTTQPKQAPENRVEFLRILRCALTEDDFKEFSKALVSYKNDNTFDELMTLLCNLLGKPSLHYMLLGMRRFLKNEHRELFDKRMLSYFK